MDMLNPRPVAWGILAGAVLTSVWLSAHQRQVYLPQPPHEHSDQRTTLPERFYVAENSPLGTWQHAYLVKERGADHCVLVIESDAPTHQAIGLTSQPWPCDWKWANDTYGPQPYAGPVR